MKRIALALGMAICLGICGGCTKTPLRITVLSYNIHHGEGTDGRFDLPRLAEVIQAQRPDLVALQEVDQATTRSSGVDQAAELGRLTGMHAVFGKAMNFAGGGYGEAVLSRWPIAGSTNHPLPATSGYEPRAAIAVDVQPRGPRGPTIRFVGTHLDHTRDPTNRLMQIEAIRQKLVMDDGPPTILAGDLNATPNTREMQTLAEHWSDAAAIAAGIFGREPAPTYPAERPRVRIDYVLLRPMIQQTAGQSDPPRRGWRVVEARVIDEPVASDHSPLLVVLEWVE